VREEDDTPEDDQPFGHLFRVSDAFAPTIFSPGAARRTQASDRRRRVTIRTDLAACGLVRRARSIFRVRNSGAATNCGDHFCVCAARIGVMSASRTGRAGMGTSASSIGIASTAGRQPVGREQRRDADRPQHVQRLALIRQHSDARKFTLSAAGRSVRPSPAFRRTPTFSSSRTRTTTCWSTPARRLSPRRTRVRPPSR
jgi:hypothetical protein